MKTINKISIAMLLLIGGVSLFSCKHEHSIMNGYQHNESTHWQECFGCNDKFNEEAHSFGEWSLNNSKTEESRECECGYIETRAHEEAHSKCIFTNYISNNDATCTSHATETAKCDVCNKTDTRKIDDSKLPHSFTDYENNHDATCTSNATETAKCDNCTKTSTREVENSKLPHSFTDYENNHDATCARNATETAKCDNCDEKDTREIENSKLKHNLGELVLETSANCTQTGMKAHYQCIDCGTYLTETKIETELENLIIPISHNYGKWQVTTPATFEKTGVRTRVCECSHIEEQEIPVLVAVNEAYTENEDIKVIEGSSAIELSGCVNPVDAENYQAQWISSNEDVVKIELIDNEYKAIIKEVPETEKEIDVTITFKVANVLDGMEYSSVTDSFNIKVIAKSLVAEFNFENGLANTGSDATISGYLFSNATDTRGQVLDVDSSTYIHTTHTVGSTTYNLGSNAILSSHVASRPSFGTSGFDFGSGDFTISIKHYMPSDFIKANYDSKNNQWCVMSVNSEANSTNKLFIYLGKDSASAGYFRPIVNLNGTKVNLFEYNVSGYYSGRKWTEYRVVKEGTKVTVTIIPSSVETNAKCIAYSVEFTLESAADFTLTPEQVIGFGNNYGTTRPGNDSYYDDIKVWNYAVDFE